jgi:hypothetical protein
VYKTPPGKVVSRISGKAVVDRGKIGRREADAPCGFSELANERRGRGQGIREAANNTGVISAEKPVGPLISWASVGGPNQPAGGPRKSRGVNAEGLKRPGGRATAAPKIYHYSIGLAGKAPRSLLFRELGISVFLAASFRVPGEGADIAYRAAALIHRPRGNPRT